ncbi:GroES (chaperonin 10)-like protein [Rhypophila sp. PSN 637]
MSPHSTRRLVRQYVATKQGGPFQIIQVEYPTPGPDEICIRNRAVALNPLDIKSLDHGMMVRKWPEVFGIDAAGVVEAVGDRVTDFKAGDAVMSLAGFGGQSGAFQDVTVVPAHFAAKKPSAWTFEEAASVPLIYLTASAAILKGLSVRLPFIQDPPKDLLGGPDGISHIDPGDIGAGTPVGAQQPPAQLPKSVLVLGGSSGIGSSTLQLLRVALGPSVTLLSTNSPANNVHCLKLGANTCIDRSYEMDKLMAAIRDASPGKQGVDAIIDAVGALSPNPAGPPVDANNNKDSFKIFETLNKDGPKLFSQVMTSPHSASLANQIPAELGIKVAQPVFGRMTFEVVPGGMRAMSRLVELVDGGGGKFKLPLNVEVVGKGLESIGAGLDRLRGGVSATKLVVSL